MTLLISYYGYGYAYEAYSIGEGSGDPGGLPHRWIVRSIIPVSSFFLVLSIIHVVLSNIQILSGASASEQNNEGDA
jgi:TRAP-type mannitol/chloroaromatic compound transport system permease small subunit